MGRATDESQFNSKHGKKIFPFPYVQIGSNVLDTIGSFAGVKYQECEADHLPPSSTKVKKREAIPLHCHI
jgi:hypothetical protein